jgi:hypothetical protein
VNFRPFILLVLLALASWVDPAVAALPLPALGADAQCGAYTAKIEERYGVPVHLLDAISVVESGRWDTASKASVAWPWTVSSGGDGKYFPTKADAIAEIRRLKAAGVRNIDVGCMQVNLMYHPDAFASLEEALDPGANIAYAARFLKGLFDATNHWLTAASYYHSQTPSLAAEYRQKLEKIWNNGDGASVTRLARATLPQTAQQFPKPSTSAQVESMRAEWHAHSSRNAADEAKSIADAYRQAHIAEYMMRRQKMIEIRSGLRLARGN